MPLPSRRSPRTRLLLQSLEGRTVPATFTVQNVTDSGTGSFRQALLDAGNAAGADTIDFNPAFFNVPRTVSLVSTLNVTSDVTILGPGAGLLTVTGNSAVRVFNVSDATATTPGILTVTMQGLTVTGGRLTSGDGAGLYTDDETVMLDQMTVSGNAVNGLVGDSGGGIAVGDGGTLTVRDSTVSGNTATGRGGGIYFFLGGTFLLENSTVSGNSSTVSTNGGGGVYFYGQVNAGFTIRNSTISGNSAAGSGGGLMAVRLNGTISVLNSTVTNNVGTPGFAANGAGGIAIGPVSTSGGATFVLNLRNSIVSGNTNAAFAANDIYTAPTATTNANFCAFGTTAGATLSGTSGNNVVGQALHLQPLANNGGATQTHALGAGSAALNVGDPAFAPPPATDQRGSPRVSGTRVDVGAFERSDGSLGAGGTFSNVLNAGATAYTLLINYGDATGIDAATLGDGDVRVTGPNGYSQTATLVAGSVGGTATLRTASYTVPAPGGAFDLADNGVYTVSVVAGQVTNTGGTAVPAGAIGTFRVAIPGPLIVTSAGDNGTGTLRDILTQANATAAIDTIQFGPAFATAQTISLLTALPTITDGFTLAGPGVNLLTIRRDPSAGTSFRVLNFGGATAYAASVAGVRVTGGVTAGTTLGTRGGGGIAVSAGKTLTLLDSEVSGNTASGEGGGIYVGNGGSLTVRNSTVSGNTAGTDAASPYRVGGGIYMKSGGTLLVENSTISGNSTPTIGGGIYLFANAVAVNVTVRNCTIAQNVAANGGGIGANIAGTQANTLVIQNSTIVGNTTTAAGGGLRLAGAAPAQLTTTLVSSVVAFNTAPTGPDVSGTANASFSLVRTQTGATLPNYGTQNNIAAGTDPLFVGGATPTLAANGGPTRTIALQNSSPLRDVGSNSASLTTDQRGFLRSSGGGVDIGAFEVQAPPRVAGVVVNGGQTNLAQRSRVTSITVTFDTAVTFLNPGNVALAFQIARVGGSSIGGFTGTAALVNGATVVTLSGFTGIGTESGSLADGFYSVTALASQISAAGGALDGDGNGTGGDNYVLTGTLANGLFRLFGDVNGDGSISGGDFGAFRLAFGTSVGQAGYVNYLDFDGNGSISGTDFGNFRIRFGTNVP